MDKINHFMVLIDYQDMDPVVGGYMDNRGLVGVNEDKIDKLVLDIYDYIERINNVLNNMENEMDKTASCFDCSAGRDLRSRFNEQKSMFPIIRENFMKDAELLIKVKSRTGDFSKELAGKIKNNAAGVEVEMPKH